MTPTKIALISVYNKDGIEKFAQSLVDLGWQILSSGGTAKKLSAANIPVKDVAELVGGQAILGHRVVTLSRELHAALLARPIAEDQAEMAKLGIPYIDLVCCDFYPLKEAINKPGATIDSVIEMTDIGGPTMVRSAAKGGRIVICEPQDRDWVIAKLQAENSLSADEIEKLRAKAEAKVAEYCLDSAIFHSQNKFYGLLGQEIKACKYGEDPYLTPASLYSVTNNDPLGLDKIQLLEGTDPSFINWTDIDRLLQTMTHIAAGFDLNFAEVPLLALGVKHGNTCGAAYGSDPKEVIKKMLLGDHLAIFGGLVMFNFELTAELVEVLLTTNMPAGQRLLLDGVIAPSISPEAVEMLKRKKDKCRILINPALKNLNKTSLQTELRLRQVRGGFLLQPNFTFVLDFKHPELTSTGTISAEQKKDLILAWAIGCTSNSNTTTLVKDGQLLGNGVGQQSRVASCQLAIFRAQASSHDLNGAIAYTDSFFPFTDGPAELAKAGIKVIFSSSGSVKDPDVQKFCQDNTITLLQLPDKTCRGFFGH